MATPRFPSGLTSVKQMVGVVNCYLLLQFRYITDTSPHSSFQRVCSSCQEDALKKANQRNSVLVPPVLAESFPQNDSTYLVEKVRRKNHVASLGARSSPSNHDENNFMALLKNQFLQLNVKTIQSTENKRRIMILGAKGLV